MNHAWCKTARSLADESGFLFPIQSARIYALRVCDSKCIFMQYIENATLLAEREKLLVYRRLLPSYLLLQKEKPPNNSHLDLPASIVVLNENAAPFHKCAAIYLYIYDAHVATFAAEENHKSRAYGSIYSWRFRQNHRGDASIVMIFGWRLRMQTIARRNYKGSLTRTTHSRTIIKSECFGLYISLYTRDNRDTGLTLMITKMPINALSLIYWEGGGRKSSHW